MRRKGIILAGGQGTRLSPLTLSTSKQLLPVYNKPMIYYPLSTLMMADITEILIITTPRDIEKFKDLLGDGSQFGLKFSYIIQTEPRGLADALILGEEFLQGHPSVLVLGDNIFFGSDFSKTISSISSDTENACVFLSRVDHPENYGVAEIDYDKNSIVKIEEKPKVDEIEVKEQSNKTVQELDREKLDAKFSKKKNKKLN